MSQPAYRKEIDGLRAVAVVPVVLFHAGLKPFSGGYAGVDIFFVVSGFLITSIIAGEREAGKFTIAGFYNRRARRILPALFLIMALSLPVAWFSMLPDALQNYSVSVAAVTLFSSNILFWTQAGYFEPATELLPLLHTWSLAVEEQFYIVFPILVVLLWPLGRRTLGAVLLIAGVASLALADYQSWHSPTANFYLAPGRVWELMMGALLALAPKPAPFDRMLSRWMSEALAAGGLLMIAASLLIYDDTTRVPSTYMLLPTLGALLLLAFASERNLMGRLLASPPVAGIGLISYSAYLWHVPLFAFARLRSLTPVSTGLLLALAVLAFALAYVSWRFVELPFRNRRMVSTRTVVLASVAAALFLMGFGLAGIVSKGFADKFDPEINRILAEAQNRSRYLIGCNSTADLEIPPDKACRIGDGKSPVIAVIGDSHAAVLFEMIARKANEHGFDAVELTHNSCPPIAGFYRPARQLACSAHHEKVMAFLKDRYETVVLAARWTSDLEGEPFDNGEGGIEEGERGVIVPIGDDRWKQSEDARRTLVAEAYAKTVRDLLDIGKRVVLVYPIPEVGWNVPRDTAKRILLGAPKIATMTTDAKVFAARNRRAYAALDAIGEHPNLVRVKPETIFCNSFVPGRCAAMVGGRAFYFDDDHLNNVGAGFVADAILTAMARSPSWSR